MDDIGYFFFRVIIAIIRGEINSFVNDGYIRVMRAAAILSGTFLTIWILNKGYQILAGTSRESMTDITMQAGKMAMVVLVLTTSNFFNVGVRTTIIDIRDNLGSLVSGRVVSGTDDVYKHIDDNLILMNTALELMDAIDTTGDPSLSDAKSRSMTMALIGQATPAMVGGLLSLINEIAVGLGIVFAPIFIIALMFKQTAPMFFGWMKYMVTAMITMGVLSVMVSIATKIIGLFTGAAWLLTLTGAAASLPTLQASMLSAGLGVIVTVLMVTVPGMVATFFGTSMGHLEYNRFSSARSNVEKSNQHAAHDASQVPNKPAGGRR